MKLHPKAFLPVAFSLLFLAFWLDAGVLGVGAQVPSFENKRPAGPPEFKLDHLDPFPRDAEAYFNDHFAWRGVFQRFNARLQRVSNGRSPLPDYVVIGDDDWFFKGGLQLDIYRGKQRFTPEQLNEVVHKLLARRDSVEAQGGQYYFAVPPLKHHIYAHHLPDYVRPLNTEYATKQLYSRLRETNLRVIDLHAPLRAYADTASVEELYFRTDHHWTVKAGVIAAEAIVNRFREDGIALRPFDREVFYFKTFPNPGMTLAKLAALDEEDQDILISLHKKSPWKTRVVERPDIQIPGRFPYPENYAIHREQQDPQNRDQYPTLFVNRESFGENLLLPLSEHFGKSFFLFDEWEHDLNLEEYKREGGDIYLQLVWEGFLFNLLELEVEDGSW
jgi:alginate O-acetyltransferase complex protein AlgJ